MICIVAWAMYERTQRAVAEGKLLYQETKFDAAAEVVKTYTDELKQNHTVVKADEHVLTQKDVRSETAISRPLLDTISMAINVMRKQVEQYTKISMSAESRALKAERRADSLQRVTYTFQDKWLSLAYRPADPADTTDAGEFDFKYNADLSVTQYWKRKWLLGAKMSYIDIYSNDPRVSIRNLKRLTVEQREPLLGLRVQAVSSYGFADKGFRAGVGLQFDVKRFSVLGSYLYNTDRSAWNYSMGARYDMLRF